MMKRLTTIFILVPVGVIILALAVANRQSITLAVPPQVNGEPLLSVSIPLFAIIFVALLIGMVIGSFATWVKQGRHRKLAQVHKVEATKATFEAQKQKERADSLAGVTPAEEAKNKLGLLPSRSSA